LKKIRLYSASFVIALFIFGSISCGTNPVDTNDEVAVLETGYGRIVIEFYPKEAPKHVANFKQLARSNFFDGTKFHRLVKNQGVNIAIQGGDPNTINGDPSTWGMGQPNQKTVAAEFSKSLKHVRGVVSMARKGNDINSGTSQFFICTSDFPDWDGQYSIFGKVIEGMKVVDSIVRAPITTNTDRPVDAVVVNKVSIVKRDQVANTP
jgi:cyclophilin family peptidyl-prolyl cis-trans isomerase